jgi:glycosyltransferase involved in cell wall biosynthesis
MGLNIQCFLSYLSYGIASKNIISNLHLVTALSPIAVFPNGPIQLNPLDDNVLLLQQYINNTSNYSINGHSLKIGHQFSLEGQIGNESQSALTIFELNTLTDRERHHINALDKIFVCSHWAKKIINEQTKHKQTCYVAPLGVNPTIFNLQNNKPHEDKFVIVNIGKWEQRKGHDFIIDVFNAAFDPMFDKDVELWMFPANPFPQAQEQVRHFEHLYKSSPMGQNVKIWGRFASQTEISHALSSADVGFFPSHAEGFNLPVLELMAMGKQVIVTNYSAHTEYCNDENSHLIPTTDLEPAFDGVWFNNQGYWASFDQNTFDFCVEKLRKLHMLKKNGVLEQNNAGVLTASQFSWKNTAQKIIDGILA